MTAIASGVVDLPELKNAHGALKRLGCEAEAQFDYSKKGEGLSLTFAMDLDQFMFALQACVSLFQKSNAGRYCCDAQRRRGA